MNFLKSHFWYSNSQRNGILFLVAIIVILQLIYFFVDFPNTNIPENKTDEIIAFQKEIDSLKQIKIEDSIPKIFPFNPSFLTDYKGYQLGMTTQEIDRLLKYRQEGNYINSAKQFQEVTKISDSLLNEIKPYFKFPKWVIEQQKNKSSSYKKNKNSKNISKTIEVKDLNTATIEDLKSVRGVGDGLANRIIKYRKLLGGYSLDDQLYEVYYLDKEVANRVLEKFKVIKKPKINKINVNTASFKQVLSIVYIDYGLTKKIFEYRDEVAEIQSLEELKKIEGFPIEKFDRIALYLQAK